MKINITNEEKLTAAIKEAEGRATARTVTANDIIRVLNNVGKGIPKTKLSGTIVHYDGAEHFPNAYKYRPESTHWTAENIKGKWYVTNIARCTCPNRERWNTSITYSEEAKQAILDNVSFVNY